MFPRKQSNIFYVGNNIIGANAPIVRANPCVITNTDTS